MFFIKNKSQQVESLIKKICKLNKVCITPKNRAEITSKTQKLHSTISKFLFEAVNTDDYKIMEIIIKNNFIKAELVFDSNGHNIVQHSLAKNNTKLFKNLYSKYYDFISSYFKDVPAMFLFTINSKNVELIEFFLKEEFFLKNLDRNNLNICLYFALQNDLKNIVKCITCNECLEQKITGSDIQSILIYSISHKLYKDIKEIFSCKELISKINNAQLENLLALIIIFKDINALNAIIDNEMVIKHIVSRKEILETITTFAFSHKHMRILSIILKNKNPNVEEKIPNKKDDDKSKIVEDSL